MEEEIVELMKKAGIEASKEKLERPPRPDMGDFAYPCFDLAKVQRKAPNLIAKDAQEKISKALSSAKGEHKPAIKEVRAIGGYVNFFLDWDALSAEIITGILKKDEGYGRPEREHRQKIMVEYSQPNPVHSMHIGHARGTFLGDGLSNLFTFLGHEVIRANYMNDCGLQVAKLVTAYQLWGDEKLPPKDEKPDVWLWKLYVKYHEEAEKDPKLDEKARENLRLIDVVKDREATALRDRIVGWCIEGFEQTYKEAGIRFDVYLFESKFRDKGKEVVEQALKKGLAFESEEKTIVADLQKHAGMPGFVILRSDGTGLYQTSDLGATIYKFEHYNLDKAIWVVASAQNLYFQQVKKLFELLGYRWEKDAIHFSFDLVRLPEGTMSSRKGKAVLLDDVMRKLSDMAYAEVSKRNPDSDEAVKRDAAKAIGIGSLKYAIEKIQPEQGITFDFEKMMSFEGNTGPYLQYAHTRCASILSKAGVKEADLRNAALPAAMHGVKAEEEALLRLLSDFPSVVHKAADEMHINDICNYSFEVATAFSSFYQVCPVLKADSEEQKEFRLALVVATKTVLRNALRILGMVPIEKM